MRCPLFLLLGPFLAVFLSACATNGEIRVRNRTAADVYASVDNSDPWRIEAWTNKSQFFAENKTIEISYIGDYVFPNTISHEVRQNFVTTFDITPGGGAINFFNDIGEQSLTEVFISPNEDPGWGPNDLSAILAPADSTLWTVTEGVWDIKAVDEAMNTYYLYGQKVTLNQTLWLRLSAFAKGEKGGAEKSSGMNK